MPDDETDGFLSGLDDEDQTDEEDKGEDEDPTEGFLEGVEEESQGFLEGLDEEPQKEEKERVSYKPEIHFSSSESMDEVGSGEVDLIITSPPYNADWAYGSHDDKLNYETEYLPMLARVFTEAWRVLRPGGRMIVNVPTLLRGGASGGQSIISDIDTMINSSVDRWSPVSKDGQDDIIRCINKTGFVHREFIIWNKGFNTDGLAPNGSFPRPWGVLLNNMHEGASVYQKPGDREYDEMSNTRIENSKIDKRSDDLCDDVWNIHPEAWSFKYVDGEDVPPFPEEFVRRCIALWSYEGDTVLDPFAGRFTTGKVAKQMNRYSIGYELREELKQDIEEYTGINQSGLGNWQ